MADRGGRLRPALAAVLAVGVAVGLLLMHGLDARAVADGHGFAASPSVTAGAAHAAPDTADAMGDPVTTAAGAAPASMVGQCIAVLAAGGLLLVLRLAHRLTLGRPRNMGSPGGVDERGHGGRRATGNRPPPLPRIALCVSLC